MPYIEKFGESLSLHLLPGENPEETIQRALDTGEPIRDELDGKDSII
ncbi:hypothetical protein [Lacticaseibacillus songhuajiangensis]|jgi:hypothetical protein|nr:hypothetical protein [Lacticaseibacillus songhuajiangensis]